jgi:hypothetical protein
MTPYFFVVCGLVWVRWQNDLKQNGTGSVPADLWFDRTCVTAARKPLKSLVKAGEVGQKMLDMT